MRILIIEFWFPSLKAKLLWQQWQIRPSCGRLPTVWEREHVFFWNKKNATQRKCTSNVSLFV